MIKAKFFKDNQGNLSGFDISGHAGYAEEGSDIICAAVSAIAYTAVGYFEEKKICGTKPNYSECDGHMKLSLSQKESQSTEAKAVLEAALIGLKQIEFSYGSEYVKVID